jgi:hypothetical protein
MNTFGFLSSSGTVPSVLGLQGPPAIQNFAQPADLAFDAANMAAGQTFMAWLVNFTMFRNGVPDGPRTQAAVAVMSTLLLITLADCNAAGASPVLFMAKTQASNDGTSSYLPCNPNYQTSFLAAKLYAASLN